MEGARPTFLRRYIEDKIVVAIDDMPAMMVHFFVQLPFAPPRITKRDEPARRATAPGNRF